MGHSCINRSHCAMSLNIILGIQPDACDTCRSFRYLNFIVANYYYLTQGNLHAPTEGDDIAFSDFICFFISSMFLHFSVFFFPLLKSSCNLAVDLLNIALCSFSVLANNNKKQANRRPGSALCRNRNNDNTRWQYPLVLLHCADKNVLLRW